MAFLFRSYLHRRCRILLILAVFCYAISKIPVDYFVLDLLDHFQPYYFLFFALMAILSFGYFKDKKLAIYSLGALALSLTITFIPLLPHISLSAPWNKASLKIMSVNVLASNNEYAKIQQLIQEENPDLLAIIELSPDQYSVLGTFLGSAYPYQFIRPVANPTGIGLFSKQPLEEATFEDPAQDNFGLISASINIDHKTYNLIAAHPFPPINQNGLQRRTRVYQNLPVIRKNPANPTIILGDFNNTLWSGDFQKLMQAMDVQVNLLSPMTWPAIKFFPKIGIDHILIPKNSYFVSIRRGPDMGSDHYPVIAEILL